MKCTLNDIVPGRAKGRSVSDVLKSAGITKERVRAMTQEAKGEAQVMGDSEAIERQRKDLPETEGDALEAAARRDIEGAFTVAVFKQLEERATIRTRLLELAVMGSNMPPDKAVKLASQYYDWVYADKRIEE